ncbi:ABC transporter transmembrane domain-containing protein [Mucilaginibacter antarcticus]|uniref:ABC transporter transmembrane domain-containing protein n=1 Tax=Mucilaginibacter antarcticus TaxID=1855725 RepID=UPI0036267C74
MKILLSYLKNHRWTVVLALLLAGINIGFSLLDPLITGKLLDNYILPKDSALYTYEYRLHGALVLIGLAIGAAMISRIAKNFQDYFTNIIVLKTGAQMYSDGLRHSLELPYQVFEDQRSGETLGILQKVRIDCEKFITSFISVLFVSVVGIGFVIIYSLKINYQVTLVYFASMPIIAIVSTLLSRRIKKFKGPLLKKPRLWPAQLPNRYEILSW